MKYLLLVSHGGLAQGLRSSLTMFAGDKIGDVLAIGLKEGQAVDAFAGDVRHLLQVVKADDSLLVLADIVGGSPLTTVLGVLAEHGKLESTVVIGGMNLTMALTGLVMKDNLEGKELVDTVLDEASTALQEFVVAPTNEPDEDDI